MRIYLLNAFFRTYKTLTKNGKNVTFSNVINHFLMNAKLRILSDDLNA
jgi:hypothetical protein